MSAVSQEIFHKFHRFCILSEAINKIVNDKININSLINDFVKELETNGITQKTISEKFNSLDNDYKEDYKYILEHIKIIYGSDDALDKNYIYTKGILDGDCRFNEDYIYRISDLSNAAGLKFKYFVNTVLFIDKFFPEKSLFDKEFIKYIIELKKFSNYLD